MSSRRADVARILIPVLTGILVCAVVVAEFPELLSLTDNVSNDFTNYKVRTIGGAPTKIVARPVAGSSVTTTSKSGESVPSLAILDSARPTAHDLLILLSSLRR